jgi:D-3-phosphoglycerate dehydrogenase / 2-oxoglutarate reductase
MPQEAPHHNSPAHPLTGCVLVTAATFGMQDPALRAELERSVREVRYSPEKRPLTAAELTGRVKGVDAWIAGLDEIDAAVIAAADRLKVIARYGVGFDRVDLGAATRRGIAVTNTPGANSAAVAELTIGLMLALARQICRANRDVRAGQWPRIPGVSLAGKTVGLVGFGAVGREMARRLAAFGCRVLAADPYVDPEAVAACGAGPAALNDLLPASDFVCLHTAATPETTGMVNASFLQRMKPGAFLVNTARGELIDEAALGQAIESGHLRGAALDCFREEPPGTGHPLLRLPQVILTPHTGAHTDDAGNAMGRMVLEACLAVLRGARPAHVVNPAVYTDMKKP